MLRIFLGAMSLLAQLCSTEFCKLHMLQFMQPTALPVLGSCMATPTAPCKRTPEGATTGSPFFLGL